MRKHNGLVVCLFTMILVVCVVFGHEARAQGGLTRIADNVYSYVGVKGCGPQNSFGANAGIVIGKEGIVVIDTLISSKEAKRFLADIKAVSDKPIKYVVNTHHHLDHAFGNAEFEKLGAVIVGHINDKKSAQEQSEGVLKNSKAYGLTESDMEGTSISYPTLTFSDRMEIDLGDQVIQLIYPQQSHTNGSILVYLPDKKILFTGDILFTDFHPFMADGNIKSWIRVLDGIVKMDVDKIIPGHGPLSSKKDILDMKKYLIAFDKKAKQLSAKSKNVDYIVSEMKKTLPPKSEGEWLIKANVQMDYVKK